MTRFSVQPAELRALGRTLGDVHGRLARVTELMSSLGGTATGHRRLAEALEDFAEEWRFSLGRIKEHAEGIEVMVIQAADAYTEVDAEVARAARG